MSMGVGRDHYNYGKPTIKTFSILHYQPLFLVHCIILCCQLLHLHMHSPSLILSLFSLCCLPFLLPYDNWWDFSFLFLVEFTLSRRNLIGYGTLSFELALTCTSSLDTNEVQVHVSSGRRQLSIFSDSYKRVHKNIKIVFHVYFHLQNKYTVDKFYIINLF